MKILVPTDFSKSSKNAAQYASKMASKFNTEIILLNAVFIGALPDASIFKAQNFEEAMASHSKQNCLKLIHEFKAQNKKLNISYKIVSGEPLTQIVENYAVHNDIDLIVMGTKGASGVEKALFGSNAASVISNSSIPVITVPERSRFNGIKHIIYASDLYTVNKEVKPLISFAKLFNAHIHIIHIASPDSKKPSDKTKITNDLVTKYKYPHISIQIFLDDDIIKGIEKYIRELKGDLLVMFTHDPSFFEKLFGKSATREMSFHSSIPLLSMKINHNKRRKSDQKLTYSFNLD